MRFKDIVAVEFEQDYYKNYIVMLKTNICTKQYFHHVKIFLEL